MPVISSETNIRTDGKQLVTIVYQSEPQPPVRIEIDGEVGVSLTYQEAANLANEIQRALQLRRQEVGQQ